MSTFVGALGEVLAGRYLRDKGYELLSANFRTRFGEIDIVAKDKDTLVFVEVKTRSEGMIALPLESVDRDKQRKITLAAEQYLRWQSPDAPARFDVIEVYLDDKQNPTDIRHIRGAFESNI